MRSITEREAGTWSVVAENKLGSSCRDWRVTVEREEEETSGGEMDSEEEEEDTEDEVLEEDLSVISADLYLARPVVINSGEEEEDLGKTVVDLGPQVRRVLTVKVMLSFTKVGESTTDPTPSPLPCSPPAVDPAPAPGSIAEREHRKWEEDAVKLENNPYSSEAVKRRLSLSRSASFSTPNLTLNQSHRSLKSVGADQEKKIDCGLRSVVASRYSRDYIILPSGRDSEARAPSPTPSPLIWAESGESEGSSGVCEERTGDSGVGSSSERGGASEARSSSERTSETRSSSETQSSGEQTSELQSSTTTVSVVEEIRRFEVNIEQSDSSQSHLEWQRLKGPPTPRSSHLSTSMDSLLESEPAPAPRPTTPPQPARRRLAGSGSPQKRVTIATEQLVTVHSMSCSPELEMEDCDEDEPPPCLPSVRELAVRWQYCSKAFSSGQNFDKKSNLTWPPLN